jgi:ABC-type glycerol-3-phosphate transport system substrate-binding protein
MDFYTNYGLEREFSFVNRFRTGEMPIGIADYTTYNLLSVSAPEINGLWGMALLPGIKQADGSINNVAPSGGAGAVIMNAAEDPGAAWEFLKWWTSADVQYRYGTELEAVMGTGARYNTANIEAFKRLPWTAADRKSLLRQMDMTQGTPQVPGGYYTSRYLDFAKIAVYDQKQNPKDTLLEYVDEINGEIRQKRLEFGLP